jgi:hypothetical protein
MRRDVEEEEEKKNGEEKYKKGEEEEKGKGEEKGKIGEERERSIKNGVSNPSSGFENCSISPLAPQRNFTYRFQMQA